MHTSPSDLCLALLGLASVDLLHDPLHALLQALAGLGGARKDLPGALSQLVEAYR